MKFVEDFILEPKLYSPKDGGTSIYLILWPTHLIENRSQKNRDFVNFLDHWPISKYLYWIKQSQIPLLRILFG